jgi:hypothetical protein
MVLLELGALAALPGDAAGASMSVRFEVIVD